MRDRRSSGAWRRRDVLFGAGAAVFATTRVATGQVPGRPAKIAAKFDIARFVDDCKHAAGDNVADAQGAVRDVLARSISDYKSVLTGVGEPQKGGIQTLYRSASLTILNIVWSPLMQLMPHEHKMWALIGIYTGREDNIFWQRQGTVLAARTASAFSQGTVTPLPRDVIHSVTNPIEKLTGAIHVYGGDFFAVHRSEWDPETLTERDWDITRAIRLFKESNERFFGR